MTHILRLVWAALVLATMPAFATAITADGTWYNFKTVAGQDFGAGTNYAYNHTSFDPFYSNPGTPPWTFTATGAGANLIVLDGGELGDVYNVYDNGVLLGATSAIPAGSGQHSCGDLPLPCLADSLMSKATFVLGAGAHSITIAINTTPFPNSYLSWFSAQQLPTVPISAVPEPGTFALIGVGLVGMGLLRRRQKQ